MYNMSVDWVNGCELTLSLSNNEHLFCILFVITV